MNTLAVFNLCLGIYFITESDKFATGEEFPPRQFQYLKMDNLHRGSFNDTDCLRELLNCWEVVKADIICTHGVVFESVCGVMKRDCSEKTGYIFQREIPLYETFCKSVKYNSAT
ncbi:uncharacterized protein LOC124539699 [Vanessa cardui]|uniref:uncharacterized protein LOC124539699 n=1 Tax=Vanessa cardui TaxID=171605 RepID=UPI001F13E546|nr:uncharacterized protein LOC124539699 [Vanessa cardui]